MTAVRVKHGTPDCAAEGWQGLSSDDLPMTVADGSTFHAVDTGEQWIFHDGGWVPDRRLVWAIREAHGLPEGGAE